MKRSLSDVADREVWSAAQPAIPRRFAAAAIALLAVALHAPALWNGFVWDDQVQVLANRWLTSWAFVPTIFRSGVWDFEGAGLTNYYRPLMHIAYLGVYQAFGAAPWAFHALNVLADAAAAVLVMTVAERLLVGSEAPVVTWPAFAAGLLFAANPVHVEPVAWVAALPDVAGTTLAMAALFVHLGQVRREEARVRGLGAAGGLFLASLLFKESFLVLPVVVGACELAIRKGGPLALRLRRVTPFVLVAAVYVVVRVAVLGAFVPKVGHDGASFHRVAAEAPALFARYVVTLLAPVDLRAWHEVGPANGWQSAVGLLAVVAYLVAVAFSFRRSAAIAVGLVLFGIAVLPALYTAGITGGRFAERYLYFPSSGMSLAAAGALAALAGRHAQRAGWTAVAALVVAGCAITLRQLPAWHDELSLWSDAVRKEPRAALPRYNLGSALLKRGRVAEATAELREAIALGLEPTARAAALVNLGRIAEEERRPEDATRLYREAVATDPRSTLARANLGAALAEAGQPWDALEHLRVAVELRPGDADLRYNLALALFDVGRGEEARAELEAAARLAPYDPEIAARLRSIGGARRTDPGAPGGR